MFLYWSVKAEAILSSAECTVRIVRQCRKTLSFLVFFSAVFDRFISAELSIPPPDSLEKSLSNALFLFWLSPRAQNVQAYHGKKI